MAHRVIVKWGGGLITHKERFGALRDDVLAGLAGAVADLRAAGHPVVLVHGAGGFGHLKARAWRLAEGWQAGWTGAQALTRWGRDEPWTPAPEADQWSGVAEVRADMLALDAAVCGALATAGVPTDPCPPHRRGRGLGMDVTLDMTDLARAASDPVPVLWGDVVEVDGPARFGILSGDDLCARLALDLPDVGALVFTLAVPGLLAAPPQDGIEPTLLATWWPGRTFEGDHASEVDVTGGIGLKAARAAAAAAAVEHVWFVDGEQPGRLVAAASGESTIGTRILATAP